MQIFFKVSVAIWVILIIAIELKCIEINLRRYGCTNPLKSNNLTWKYHQFDIFNQSRINCNYQQYQNCFYSIRFLKKNRFSIEKSYFPRHSRDISDKSFKLILTIMLQAKSSFYKQIYCPKKTSPSKQKDRNVFFCYLLMTHRFGAYKKQVRKCICLLLFLQTGYWQLQRVCRRRMLKFLRCCNKYMCVYILYFVVRWCVMKSFYFV